MKTSFTASICAILAGLAVGETLATESSDDGPRLRAASLRFAVTAQAGSGTESRTGAVVGKVHGPLKTTVTLLEDGPLRLCLIATDSSSILRRNMSIFCRREVAKELQLPVSHVLIFSSHNHGGARMASNQTRSYDTQYADDPEPEFLPFGRQFIDKLRSRAKRLPDMLQPVSVWWAEGREGRITYNRKGRRADGSTYFMREEDRILLGEEFRGDIDQQAPVVVLKNRDGRPLAALAQFTGHPVTSYHPERPVVFGEWPQVACDALGEHLSPGQPLPVGFLQGCAGDVNSKKMFRGGVETSTQYGRMLGSTYIEALDDLKPSNREGLDYSVKKVQIPLAPLPSKETLLDEVAEMEDFIRRASAGEQNTLECVGLNFPRDPEVFLPSAESPLISKAGFRHRPRGAVNVRRLANPSHLKKYVSIGCRLVGLDAGRRLCTVEANPDEGMADHAHAAVGHRAPSGIELAVGVLPLDELVGQPAGGVRRGEFWRGSAVRRSEGATRRDGRRADAQADGRAQEAASGQP